jgi:hypothetical protein
VSFSHTFIRNGFRRSSCLCCSGLPVIFSSSEDIPQLCPVSFEPPEGVSNSAVAPLKPSARTSCASLALPKVPESISRIAFASPAPTRRRLRMSLRSTRLARRPPLLSGPVVGAGRDPPKSLSCPGRRRPHKVSVPKYFLLASTASVPSGLAV